MSMIIFLIFTKSIRLLAILFRLNKGIIRRLIKECAKGICTKVSNVQL